MTPETHTQSAHAARAFAWTWEAFVRCARTLGAAVLVSFVVGVTAGVYIPLLPARVLEALQSVALWPGDLVSGLVPIYLVILLGNMKSAFVMALLGPVSVWVNARLNTPRGPDCSPAGAAPDWSVRVACALAGACIRVGRRVFPEIGDESREFAARSSAGLAAALPFLALCLNGTVAGLWLAEGLLQQWTAGLLAAFGQLLPHGPLEFTALLLAAAAGLNGARLMVPSRREHDSAWQGRQAVRWLTSNCVAQSLGLLIGLIAVAAALEVTSFA